MLRGARALPVIVAASLLAPAAGAQEEPSLFGDRPAAEATPSPTPTPIPLVRPPAPAQPLRAALDFQRWQEMSARERQTFVEGTVLAMSTLATRLRNDIGSDGRVPPEKSAALTRFVTENFPTRPVAVYLREMESIYTTADGQKLSLFDCFLQGFRRVNGR
jgi:hypothetical protein